MLNTAERGQDDSSYSVDHSTNLDNAEELDTLNGEDRPEAANRPRPELPAYLTDEFEWVTRQTTDGVRYSLQAQRHVGKQLAEKLPSVYRRQMVNIDSQMYESFVSTCNDLLTALNNHDTWLAYGQALAIVRQAAKDVAYAVRTAQRGKRWYMQAHNRDQSTERPEQMIEDAANRAKSSSALLRAMLDCYTNQAGPSSKPLEVNWKNAAFETLRMEAFLKERDLTTPAQSAQFHTAAKQAVDLLTADLGI